MRFAAVIVLAISQLVAVPFVSILTENQLLRDRAAVEQPMSVPVGHHRATANVTTIYKSAEAGTSGPQIDAAEASAAG